MANPGRDGHTAAFSCTLTQQKQDPIMAKKSRGGRMTAAKNRAAKSKGGKGPIKKRPAGRNIMKT
jgi:hypothetical protein